MPATRFALTVPSAVITPFNVEVTLDYLLTFFGQHVLPDPHGALVSLHRLIWLDASISQISRPAHAGRQPLGGG